MLFQSRLMRKIYTKYSQSGNTLMLVIKRLGFVNHIWCRSRALHFHFLFTLKDGTRGAACVLFLFETKISKAMRLNKMRKIPQEFKLLVQNIRKSWTQFINQLFSLDRFFPFCSKCNQFFFVQMCRKETSNTLVHLR